MASRGNNTNPLQFAHLLITDELLANREQTRMWTDAQRDGRPAEYSGALCESSVIPFLVPRRKVWLTPLLECRGVTLPI